MRKRILIISLAILAFFVIVIAGNTARNAARWTLVTETPAQRLAELEPDWRLEKPDGPGPFPAAILLSGCDGVHDNMDLWAREMVGLGRAALILDSHKPRGLVELQAWRTVCAAQILTGAERAGDIAIAMTALSKRPDIRPDDMVILGASHGGWAALEYMDLLGSGETPPGLTEWPMPPETLAGAVGQLVLLYPYCGIMNGGGDARWPKHVGGLMILSGKDSIVDPQQCRDMADNLRTHGASIEVATIAGADHGFDQHDHSVLSLLTYVQTQVDEATALVATFISGYRKETAP